MGFLDSHGSPMKHHTCLKLRTLRIAEFMAPQKLPPKVQWRSVEISSHPASGDDFSSRILSTSLHYQSIGDEIHPKKNRNKHPTIISIIRLYLVISSRLFPRKNVRKVDELLTEDEWSTVHPIARLNEMLMQHCRGKQVRVFQVWSLGGSLEPGKMT